MSKFLMTLPYQKHPKTMKIQLSQLTPVTSQAQASVGDLRWRWAASHWLIPSMTSSGIFYYVLVSWLSWQEKLCRLLVTIVPLHFPTANHHRQQTRHLLDSFWGPMMSCIIYWITLNKIESLCLDDFRFPWLTIAMKSPGAKKHHCRRSAVEASNVRGPDPASEREDLDPLCLQW